MRRETWWGQASWIAVSWEVCEGKPREDKEISLPKPRLQLWLGQIPPDSVSISLPLHLKYKKNLAVTFDAQIEMGSPSQVQMHILKHWEYYMPEEIQAKTRNQTIKSI